VRRSRARQFQNFIAVQILGVPIEELMFASTGGAIGPSPEFL
jgi:hypothetical protein